MTGDEFDEWYRYHVARFVGISSWMAKLPTIPTDSHPVNRSDVFDAWYGTLRYHDLDDAKAASDQLAASDDQPRSFDRHPAAVAAIARHRKSERQRRERSADFARRQSTGDESYRCLVCRDEGDLLCWHPVCMAVIQENHSEIPDKFVPYRTVVRCTCQAGDESPYQWMRRLAATDLPLDRYEGGRLVIASISDEDEQWRLCEHVAGLGRRAATA